jgi:hypothetical protein
VAEFRDRKRSSERGRRPAAAGHDAERSTAFDVMVDISKQHAKSSHGIEHRGYYDKMWSKHGKKSEDRVHGRFGGIQRQRQPPQPTADMGSSTEAHPVAFHGRISTPLSVRENPNRAPSGGGEDPELIGQSRAVSRPRHAKICQVQLGKPKVT